jgi:hypothetical protein
MTKIDKLKNLLVAEEIMLVIVPETICELCTRADGLIPKVFVSVRDLRISASHTGAYKDVVRLTSKGGKSNLFLVSPLGRSIPI